jgi:hypothetical protein
MNKISTLTISALFAGLPFVGLAGCEEEGPLEEAGEEVDEVFDEAEDDLEDVGEEIEDAVDD